MKKKDYLGSTIIGLHPYEKVKEDCHKMKEGDLASRARFVSEVYNLFDMHSRLVCNAPSHNGTEYYSDMELENKTDIGIFPILVGNPRPSWYTMKKKGYKFMNLAIGTDERIVDLTKEKISEGYKLMVFDNVCDTGLTAMQSINALHNAGIENVEFITYGYTDNFIN